MTPPPLCIIPCRLNSSRLPNKMLQELGGETLIARAYRMACHVFGQEHTIVAIPEVDDGGPLTDELDRIGAWRMSVRAPEADVLERFWRVAHTLRWDPDSIIVRWTGEDPFKDHDCIRRVIAGERLPVELGCEAFTLAELDAAKRRTAPTQYSTFRGEPFYSAMLPSREHITDALFPVRPPPPPPGCWTIDTQEDLDAARAIVEATP